MIPIPDSQLLDLKEKAENEPTILGIPIRISENVPVGEIRIEPISKEKGKMESIKELRKLLRAHANAAFNDSMDETDEIAEDIESLFSTLVDEIVELRKLKSYTKNWPAALQAGGKE